MTKTGAMAAGARCDLCPCFKEGVIVPPLPSASPKGLRLIVIGDSPSRTDERTREPLSGMAGKILHSELSKNGVSRASCHVDSVALCRGESDKENERAAECCAPRLLGELSKLPPDIPILALGKAPLVAVLGVRSLLQARGFIWTAKTVDPKQPPAALKAAYKKSVGVRRDNAILKAETMGGRGLLAGRTVLPTLHPSFILRADTWNPVFQIDIRRAARTVANEVVWPLEDVGQYVVGGLELLRGLGPTVSLDTETTGIDPMTCQLLCVGVSDIERTVVIWPWKASYARKFSKFLHSRERVIIHNSLFDVPVLRAHGVE